MRSSARFCPWQAGQKRPVLLLHGERKKSPEARLKEKDKRRAAYYRFYTDMKWGDAANYHIALDSGVIGIEKSAEIIESLS